MLQHQWQYQTLAEPVPVIIPFPSEWGSTFPNRLTRPQPNHSTAVDVISPLNFDPPKGWNLETFPERLRGQQPAQSEWRVDVISPLNFTPEPGWELTQYPHRIVGQLPTPRGINVDVISPLYFAPEQGWSLTTFPDRLSRPKTPEGFFTQSLFPPEAVYDPALLSWLPHYPATIQTIPGPDLSLLTWTPYWNILINSFAYYRMDGNLLDSSGNGNDLTDVSPTYGVGILNRGLATGGGTTPDAPAGTLQNTSGTIAAWVYVQSQGTIVPISTGVVGWTNFNLETYYTSTGGAFNPTIGSIIFGVGTYDLPDARWVHIAVTWDYPSQTWVVYTNGEIVDTGTADPGSGLFGALTVSAGLIDTRAKDEIGLWTRPLTQAEIRYLAAPTDPTLPFSVDSWYPIAPTEVKVRGRVPSGQSVDVPLSGSPPPPTDVYGWERTEYPSRVRTAIRFDYSTTVDVISPLSFQPPDGWNLPTETRPELRPPTIPAGSVDVIPPLSFTPEFGWDTTYPDSIPLRTVRQPDGFTAPVSPILPVITFWSPSFPDTVSRVHYTPITNYDTPVLRDRELVPSVFLSIPGIHGFLALSGIRSFLAEAQVSALVSGKAQKEAGDIVRIPMDFGDVPELQDGANISTYDITCSNVAITVSGKQIDYDYQISALFAGGTAGVTYDLVYTIVLDDVDGTTIVRTGQLQIVE